MLCYILAQVDLIMKKFLTNLFKRSKIYSYSSLAQSVEHSAVNRSVAGSSPAGGVFENP